MTKIDVLPGLWQSAQAGDEKAYENLHTLLYPQLFSYSVRIVKDAEVADDLLQEVFINFWSRRKQIGEIKNISAYFYQSTRYIVINYLRDTKNLRSKLDQVPEPEIEFTAEDIIISKEDNSELKYTLQSLLNNLPARQREMIYLKFYEEYSYEEIVHITGIRYQSVVNHIYRAIQSMRDLMPVKAYSVNTIS